MESPGSKLSELLDLAVYFNTFEFEGKFVIIGNIKVCAANLSKFIVFIDFVIQENGCCDEVYFKDS